MRLIGLPLAPTRAGGRLTLLNVDAPVQAFDLLGLGPMNGLDELREHGGMTWLEHERGWIAAPTTVLNALVSDGFEECKSAMTTSRRDCRPAGGLWQGINPRTSSVASVIWVARPETHAATVFIEIDGESVMRTGRDPDEEEGGEG